MCRFRSPVSREEHVQSVRNSPTTFDTESLSRHECRVERDIGAHLDVESPQADSARGNSVVEISAGEVGELPQ